jgi:hypothetical protein
LRLVPAVETATIVTGGDELELDLCEQHVQELITTQLGCGATMTELARTNASLRSLQPSG